VEVLSSMIRGNSIYISKGEAECTLKETILVGM
jgi:hypothetical protein